MIGLYVCRRRRNESRHLSDLYANESIGIDKKYSLSMFESFGTGHECHKYAC